MDQHAQRQKERDKIDSLEWAKAFLSSKVGTHYYGNFTFYVEDGRIVRAVASESVALPKDLKIPSVGAKC